MELNWQTIIAFLLLMIAVGYVTRVIARAFQGKHDCPDCDVSVKLNKATKRPLKSKITP